jgi:hypothetical protein
MHFPWEYWPLMAVAAWFDYKWLCARRVTAMLPRLLEQGAALVDIRTVAEFAHGSALSNLNIPLQELAGRLDEIPRAKPVVLGCASGIRSGMAGRAPAEEGRLCADLQHRPLAHEVVSRWLTIWRLSAPTGSLQLPIIDRRINPF